MDYLDEYIELARYGKSLGEEVGRDKKRSAWEYFRSELMIPMANIEDNLSKQFIVYVSDVKRIHGSNMSCWPFKDKTEIFVDKELYTNQFDLVNVQLQHEVLHGLSQRRNGTLNSFGHPLDANNIYIGIDEAVTQMFAEDISDYRLPKQDDYLYFVKNAMRIVKVFFGSVDIANQYMNGDLSFEKKFNEFTNNRFEAFAVSMKNIYLLHKKEFYDGLTPEEIASKERWENQISAFLSNMITNYDNPAIQVEISNEIDSEFLEEYKDRLKISVGKEFN